MVALTNPRQEQPIEKYVICVSAVRTGEDTPTISFVVVAAESKAEALRTVKQHYPGEINAGVGWTVEEFSAMAERFRLADPDPPWMRASPN